MAPNDAPSGHYIGENVFSMYLKVPPPGPVTHTISAADDLPLLLKSIGGQRLYRITHESVSTDSFIKSTPEEGMGLFTTTKAKLITSQLSITTQARLIV